MAGAVGHTRVRREDGLEERRHPESGRLLHAARAAGNRLQDRMPAVLH